MIDPQPTAQAATQVVYIQPSHKFPAPERFSGSHDGFSCLAWLQSVIFYIEAIKAPHSEWTRIAVSYLTGAAILWWQSCGIKASEEFAIFEAGLRTMFLPESFLDTVRVRLYSAKLKTTVPALIQEMRMCMDILHPNPSEDTRKELELAAKSILLSALPAGLQEMLQAFLIANPDPPGISSATPPSDTPKSVKWARTAFRPYTTPSPLPTRPTPLSTLWLWKSIILATLWLLSCRQLLTLPRK